MSESRIQAGTGLCRLTDVGDRAAVARQVEACVGGVLDRVGDADAALLFVRPGSGLAVEDVVDVAQGALGDGVLLAGATAHGVLAGGEEHEASAALALIAARGLDARPFLVPDVAGDEAHVADEIAAQLDGKPGEGDLVVLLPDPHAVNVAPMIEAIRERIEPARLVGAGASDPDLDQPRQWSGRHVEAGAVAGMVWRGRSARVGVTQACRPVTDPMTVTRCEGSWILELDGRPALDVYREAARAPLAEDLRRAAAFLLVALPADPKAPLDPGSYVVRNVAGIATDQRAIAIPGLVRRGQAVAFAAREPETARDDLKAMLDKLGGNAAMGLYFNCCARGAGFFGVAGLEAAYIDNALRDTPVAGMFGAFELGPIGPVAGGAAQTELLTYTGVLALLD